MGETSFDAPPPSSGVPGQPGRYRAVLTDQWSAPVLPHGGIITALALRAMAAELGSPDERLRSVTTVFAAQVPPGPVHIDVTVLRRGGPCPRLSPRSARRDRRRGPAPGHSALAVFG